MLIQLYNLVTNLNNTVIHFFTCGYMINLHSFKSARHLWASYWIKLIKLTWRITSNCYHHMINSASETALYYIFLLFEWVLWCVDWFSLLSGGFTVSMHLTSPRKAIRFCWELFTGGRYWDAPYDCAVTGFIGKWLACLVCPSDQPHQLPDTKVTEAQGWE